MINIMQHPNDIAFAKKICHYSIELKPGEKVWVELIGLNGIGLVQALVKEIRAMGGEPFVKLMDPVIKRTLLDTGNKAFWQTQCKLDGEALMEEMDAFIGIRASENGFESCDIDQKKLEAYNSHYLKPVHLEKRVKGTKWVIMRYPSAAFAMNARMSTEAFEQFYYDACLFDYEKLSASIEPLEALLRKTDRIRLKGEGTDISFSVKGQNWIPCVGKRNLPDGELFSAPILDSINGTISYAPSLYDGKPFDFVKLVVKEGVVVDYDSSNNKALSEILETDAGAKRFGEFSFGLNTRIKEPMWDILFDEKIYGSNHLTLGQDYDEASNGNSSTIHWDLVNIGSDVYCDDVLVRKGRLFVLDQLKALNP